MREPAGVLLRELGGVLGLAASWLCFAGGVLGLAASWLCFASFPAPAGAAADEVDEAEAAETEAVPELPDAVRVDDML